MGVANLKGELCSRYHMEIKYPDNTTIKFDIPWYGAIVKVAPNYHYIYSA